MAFQRIIAGLMATVTLSACAGNNGGGPLGIVMLSSKQHVASAEPLFSDKEDVCLDSPAFLISMFTDHPNLQSFKGKDREACEDLSNAFSRMLSARSGDATKPIPTTAAPDDKTPTVREESTSTSKPTIHYDTMHRNEIIDGLIAASNRKCGRYIAFLKTYDGNVNSTFGLASLITGGLSAFVGGESTAKALGGTSAILNGSRETFNQAHFSNQTIQVLAAAFEKAREDRRKHITAYQQCPISQYTLMRGVEDAFQYHSECSVVFGLAEAARAVERANNPDIATMKTMLADLQSLKKQAKKFGDDSDDDGSTPVSQNGGAAAPAGAPPTADGAAAPANNNPANAATAAASTPPTSSDPPPSCPFGATQSTAPATG